MKLLNSINRKYKTALYTLMFLIVVKIIAFVWFSSFLEVSQHNSALRQSKTNLDHIELCLNQYIDLTKDTSRVSIQKWLDMCAQNMFVWWKTWDVFAVDLRDMSLLWDNSSDCKTNKVAYLKEWSVCDIASDSKSCIELANRISKWYWWTYTWQFDDSEETTTWKILPLETTWFGWLKRSTSKKWEVFQIAVAQWFQADEVRDNLKYAYLLLYVLCTIWLIFSIMSVTFITILLKNLWKTQ